MSHPRRLPFVVFVLALAVALAACGDDSGSGAGESTAASSESEPDEVDDPATDGIEVSTVAFVPGKGITGASVGDTREEVVAALGEPIDTTDVKNEFSGGTNERMEYDGPQVSVLLQEVDGSSAVIQVEVTDPTIVTQAGDISIGSTQAQLLQAFPAARCDTGKLHLCRLGTENAGDVVTDFFVQDGEVSRMVVGRVID